MQFPEGPEVEVEVFWVELEALRYVVNGLLQFHERYAHVLDFLRCQGLFFQPPDGLPLHELADQFDEAENELDDGLLNVLRIRIPSNHRSLPRRRRGSPALFRAKASAPFLFHAVERFVLLSFASGVPITFLISLIRSCGRHGFVMTTSHPALFALSEC